VPRESDGEAEGGLTNNLEFSIGRRSQGTASSHGYARPEKLKHEKFQEPTININIIKSEMDRRATTIHYYQIERKEGEE